MISFFEFYIIESVNNDDDFKYTLIDIISNNTHDKLKYDKYKDILYKNYNINYDDIYNDDKYIEEANLNNLKEINDFSSFSKYKEYCLKIFKLRDIDFDDNVESRFPNCVGILNNDILSIISDKLKFDFSYKEYTGSGNYAYCSGDSMVIPENVPLSVFIHELGHILDYQIRYDGLAKKMTYSTTPYGLSNSGETFAENFLNYFINGNELKNKIPILYKEMHNIIPYSYKKIINDLLSGNL